MTDQSSFQVLNPDYEARVRESFHRQAFMEHLGADVVQIEPGAVDIHLPKTDELTQQHGFYHGGVVGTLADNASGYAAYTLAPADATILTVEYKINFVSPANGDLLIARGRVIKPGRTLVTSQTEVWSVMDGEEKLAATALVTLMLFEGRSDSKS